MRQARLVIDLDTGARPRHRNIRPPPRHAIDRAGRLQARYFVERLAKRCGEAFGRTGHGLSMGTPFSLVVGEIRPPEGDAQARVDRRLIVNDEPRGSISCCDDPTIVCFRLTRQPETAVVEVRKPGYYRTRVDVPAAENRVIWLGELNLLRWPEVDARCITGRVVDAQGKAVNADGTIRISVGRATPQLTAEVERGRFRLERVFPESYTIRASLEGWGAKVTKVEVPEGRNCVELDLTGWPLRTAEFKLHDRMTGTRRVEVQAGISSRPARIDIGRTDENRNVAFYQVGPDQFSFYSNGNRIALVPAGSGLQPAAIPYGTGRCVGSHSRGSAQAGLCAMGTCLSVAARRSLEWHNAPTKAMRSSFSTRLIDPYPSSRRYREHD